MMPRTRRLTSMLGQQLIPWQVDNHMTAELLGVDESRSRNALRLTRMQALSAARLQPVETTPP